MTEETGITFRAIYYERVSTIDVSQDESMENQRRLAKSYLSRHPEVELVEPLDSYSERVSGKSDLRLKYASMMKRLEQGDIDLLLVKDLKRLNRSTEVSAQFRNAAKKYKFRLILLSTGQIYDPNRVDNRMLCGFEALVNEDSVYRQSEYGRLAHRQKMEAKRLNRNNIIFGYKWDYEKKDIVINEEQAAVVRHLFDMYCFDNAGYGEMRKYLATCGLSYSEMTICNWLKETAYIGTFHMNKKGSELGVGAGQKTKRFKNPVDEWVAVERPDLAIVDKRIFDLAQKMREIRNEKFCHTDYKDAHRRFEGNHLFASMIFCAECGYPFVHGYADRAKTIHIYRDSHNKRTKDPLKPCINKEYYRVREEDMESLVRDAINLVIRENEEAFSNVIDILRKVMSEDDEGREYIQNISHDIKSLEKKKAAIKEAFIAATGELRSEIQNDYDRICMEIQEKEQKLLEAENEKKSVGNIEARIKEIEECLSRLHEVEKLDRKTVQAFIRKITINKEGHVVIVMNSDKVIERTLPPNNKEIAEADQNGPPFLMSIEGLDVGVLDGSHGIKVMIHEFLSLNKESYELPILRYKARSKHMVYDNSAKHWHLGDFIFLVTIEIQLLL